MVTQRSGKFARPVIRAVCLAAVLALLLPLRIATADDDSGDENDTGSPSVCPAGTAIVRMAPFITTNLVDIIGDDDADLSVAPFLLKDGRDQRQVGWSFPTCETRFGPFGMPCFGGDADCPSPAVDQRFTGRCLPPDPMASKMDDLVGMGQLTPHASALFGTPFFGLLDTPEALNDLLAPTSNPPAIVDFNERVVACQAGAPLTTYSDGRPCFTCGNDCSVFRLQDRHTIDITTLNPPLADRVMRSGSGEPMFNGPVRFGRATTETAPVDADGIRGNGCDFRFSPPRIVGPFYDPDRNPVPCVVPPAGDELACVEDANGNFIDPVPETRGNECDDEISREIFRPRDPRQADPENFKVKNWLKATGMAIIRCRCSGIFDGLIPEVNGEFPQGEVTIFGRNLVPFGVYTVWLTEQAPAVPISEGGTGQAKLIGDSPPLGGTPNVFVADSKGRITILRNPIAFCPLLAERVSTTQGGRRDNTVVFVYHTDHETHGADSESPTASASLSQIDLVLGKPERRNGMVGKLVAAGPGPFGLININPRPSGTFLNVPSSNFETVGHLLGNIPCDVPALGQDVANPNFFSGAPQPEPCPNTCRLGKVGELCFTDAECDTAVGTGDGACGLETL
ncbi:MAG: hypothetical protein ACE5I7_13375 [Candidatus Binatia bacterium]